MTSATIDFLHPRRTSALGWWLLAVGVIALALSLWLDARWAGQRAEQRQAQQQREDVAARDRAAALQPVAPTPQDLRLRAIAPQLRQPWLPTLRLIENVTEAPVFLLAVSIDPGAGAVRLDGEAPGFTEALTYAHSLDDDALMGPARLRSHETTADPVTGAPVVRFSIFTSWVAK
jgi:hypothetical protein